MDTAAPRDICIGLNRIKKSTRPPHSQMAMIDTFVPYIFDRISALSQIGAPLQLSASLEHKI